MTTPKSTPLLDHLRIHGRSNKTKNSAKKQASSIPNVSAKDAALASVNKAAAKRAPSAPNSSTVAAGKGRDVKATPRSESAAGGAGGKKGKGKKKSKEETDTVLASVGAAATEVRPNTAPKKKKPPVKPPIPDAPSHLRTGVMILERPEKIPRPETTLDPLPRTQKAAAPNRTKTERQGPNEQPPAGVRSAHGAVRDILTKNARGGGVARGGRGSEKGQKDEKAGAGDTGQSQSALASQARIDA